MTTPQAAWQCLACQQTDVGQTGEYPCLICGLPTAWDARVAEPPVEPGYGQQIKMNPWQVCQDPKTLRRTGKSLEELGELIAVLARVIIQGIDEVDPGSGKTNRVRLENETADVLVQCHRTIEALGLNRPRIELRCTEKDRQMIEWESLYPHRPPPVSAPTQGLACNLQREADGMPYPRTCQRCKLGPCTWGAPHAV